MRDRIHERDDRELVASKRLPNASVRPDRNEKRLVQTTPILGAAIPELESHCMHGVLQFFGKQVLPHVRTPARSLHTAPYQQVFQALPLRFLFGLLGLLLCPLREHLRPCRSLTRRLFCERQPKGRQLLPERLQILRRPIPRDDVSAGVVQKHRENLLLGHPLAQPLELLLLPLLRHFLRLQHRARDISCRSARQPAELLVKQSTALNHFQALGDQSQRRAAIQAKETPDKGLHAPLAEKVPVPHPYRVQHTAQICAVGATQPLLQRIERPRGQLGCQKRTPSLAPIAPLQRCFRSLEVDISELRPLPAKQCKDETPLILQIDGLAGVLSRPRLRPRRLL